MAKSPDNEVIDYHQRPAEQRPRSGWIDSNRVTVTRERCTSQGPDFCIVGGGINPRPNAALSERNCCSSHPLLCQAHASTSVAWRLIEMHAASHGNLFGTFNRCPRSRHSGFRLA